MSWTTFFAICCGTVAGGALITDVYMSWRRYQARLASMRRTGARRRP